MSSGLPLRAATILSGSLLEMTAMPYVPSTCRSASITASRGSRRKNASIRCARTSVSVSETNAWPRASSRLPERVEFSMMPLCTTAIVAVLHRCAGAR